jgi:hypothetical protein
MNSMSISLGRHKVMGTISPGIPNECLVATVLKEDSRPYKTRSDLDTLKDIASRVETECVQHQSYLLSASDDSLKKRKIQTARL